MCVRCAYVWVFSKMLMICGVYHFLQIRFKNCFKQFKLMFRDYYSIKCRIFHVPKMSVGRCLFRLVIFQIEYIVFFFQPYCSTDLQKFIFSRKKNFFVAHFLHFVGDLPQSNNGVLTTRILDEVDRNLKKRVNK